MKYTILLLLIFLSIQLHAAPLDVMQNVPTTTYTLTTNRTLNLMPSVVVPVTTPTNIAWDRLSVTITNYNAADDTFSYTLGGLTLVSAGGGVYTFSANYPSSATWQAFLRSLSYKNNGWPKPDIRPRIVTVKLYDSKETDLHHHPTSDHYYYYPHAAYTSLDLSKVAAGNLNFLGHSSYLLTVTSVDRAFINTLAVGNKFWVNTNNPNNSIVIVSGSGNDTPADLAFNRDLYHWDTDAPEAGVRLEHNVWATGEPNGSGNRIYFPYTNGYDDVPASGVHLNNATWIAEFGGFSDAVENNTTLAEITREKTITIYSHVHNAPQMGVVH
ncbi:MAG: hypothetical protein EXS67_05435 [Candidatus Margulisbacteria bacterium]|nr:hypothetical protein [Candidatus Margulisiibacteriota bacterium]